MAARPPRVTNRRNQPTTRPRSSFGTGPSFISGWRNIRVGNRTLGGRPVPGANAPAAPAAPAAPQYSLSSLPPDASYDAAVGLLQRQRDDQIAALVAQRSQGLLDYGFTEGPSGTLAFDPRNPFSKAALLKKSYDTNRRSTGQSMGAGGQLYSGAFQNAQDLVNRNEAQSQDQMQKSLARFLAQNTQQRTSAGTNYELAAQQAYGDRVGRFQSNPLYDPATLDSTPDTRGQLAAAAPPSTQHEFKRVNGKLYRRIKGSSQQWVPVPGQ